jgi:hypothetical protein
MTASHRDEDVGLPQRQTGSLACASGRTGMLKRLSAGSDSLDVLGSSGRQSGQALRALQTEPLRYAA